MNMLNFKHIQSFVAVYEEGTFSRAADRIHTTQSGVSTQVSKLEEFFSLQLFERTAKGVIPTYAGKQLYKRVTNILYNMSKTESEMRSLSKEVTGHIRIGLMPTFTYTILAPTLTKFMTNYPNIEVTVVEAFSPVLSEAVARGDFDFAIVPAEQGHGGIRARPFGSDYELLVSGVDSELPHLKPVKLASMPPLKLILPTHDNARRQRLENFFITNSVKIAIINEIDAMWATLQFVSKNDWMTILPATICASEINSKVRRLNPIVRPKATVNYMLIEPLRRALSRPAELFLEELRGEYNKQHALWDKVLVE